MIAGASDSPINKKKKENEKGGRREVGETKRTAKCSGKDLAMGSGSD